MNASEITGRAKYELYELYCAPEHLNTCGKMPLGMSTLTFWINHWNMSHDSIKSNKKVIHGYLPRDRRCGVELMTRWERKKNMNICRFKSLRDGYDSDPSLTPITWAT
jgi:hypothetical protein